MIRDAILARLRARDVHSAVGNCHSPGLHSLVLEERADGSLLRVFFTTPDHQLGRLITPEGHFTLGMHNHNKALTFRVLAGSVANITAVRGLGISMHLYRYPFIQSGLLDGCFELGKPQREWVTLGIRNLDGVSMGIHEVHTVLVPTPEAAWLVDEGPTQVVRKGIYSPRADLRLSTEGLYSKLGVGEACEVLEAMLGEGSAAVPSHTV